MPVRFVFVTDSHHYPDAPKDYAAPKMLTQSQKILDAMVPAINAVSPDFIVHGGDLLCGGSSFEMPSKTYLRSIDEVANAFDQLQAPIYYVPGNHDCDARTGSFERFARRFPIPDTVDVFDAAPGVRVATVNIYQCDPFTDGQGIWTDELDQALSDAAREAYDRRCALILALHTWILPLEGETGSTTIITHADRLLETIATHPAIVMVLTGHRHSNRICLIHGCLLLDTACIIGYPMGFREITLYEDGTVQTTFRQLDLADLVQQSYHRSTADENLGWAGTLQDRDREVVLPRLHAIWNKNQRMGN
ncbi:uncharacterized protein METZ01_LOCUS184160 [marine metagenome]|uniref:Calcineurin-like phosphoesterase domain-containing protein n=1 Tax=marine metagenome TaxID=408172 RepID=A0A382CYM5_9ZZZZ